MLRLSPPTCGPLHKAVRRAQQTATAHRSLHRLTPLLPPCSVQYFSAIDSDRSGTLDVHELQKALALGGLQFSLKTVQARPQRVLASSGSAACRLAP